MQPNLLDLYPTPSELSSEDQADHFHNRDLSSRTEDDLRRELSFLRVLNFIEDSEWHLEREVQVAAELSRRRNARRHEKRP